MSLLIIKTLIKCVVYFKLISYHIDYFWHTVIFVFYIPMYLFIYNKYLNRIHLFIMYHAAYLISRYYCDLYIPNLFKIFKAWWGNWILVLMFFFIFFYLSFPHLWPSSDTILTLHDKRKSVVDWWNIYVYIFCFIFVCMYTTTISSILYQSVCRIATHVHKRTARNILCMLLSNICAIHYSGWSVTNNTLTNRWLFDLS